MAINAVSGHLEIPLVAKTVFGLEEVLARELVSLGAKDVSILTRAVAFRGDKQLMYRANYFCRTALRILKPLAEFRVQNEADLYRKTGQVEWWKIFGTEDTFAIDAVTGGNAMTNTLFIAQKAKDAIVDQFRRRFGRRPSVDTDNPGIRINLHLAGSSCTLSLDSSGASLHKRGYRRRTHEAPISEVLAAGLVCLSGWDKKRPLIDPMCGSATILIEAAMQAFGIAAGKYRRDFGFLHWRDYDPVLYRQVLQEAKSREVDNEGLSLTGIDISGTSLEQARENLMAAGLEGRIQLIRNDFRNYIPSAPNGMIITNPPYGERLSTAGTIKLYEDFGNQLKRLFAGYTAWLISSDLEAIRHIGLHPHKKFKVFNGPLECRFVGFDLYEGSKKKKQGSSEEKAEH